MKKSWTVSHTLRVHMSSPDLRSSHLWNLRLSFKSLEDSSTQRVALKMRFIERKNFEPPQGTIYVEEDASGLTKIDKNGYSGKWLLSEDKNDRKDGLWICKLFQGLKLL